MKRIQLNLDNINFLENVITICLIHKIVSSLDRLILAVILNWGLEQASSAHSIHNF